MERKHVRKKPLMQFVLIMLSTGALILSFSLVSFFMARSLPAHATPSGTAAPPFTLSSPDFRDGGPLPASSEFNKFGCHGQNIAPELQWTGVPTGAKSFALTVTDYDAPVTRGFHHGIVYNIPGTVRALEGDNPFSEGTNSYGLPGYGGPCPPPDGQLHHYVFRLYALPVSHISGHALTFNQLLQAIGNNLLGTTSIIGTFKLPS
jgi:Raf kinase inhibitor-like YbhB/YbcL family protein